MQKENTVPGDLEKDRIVFVTNRDGNVEIYIMDEEGGNLENLTQNDSLDFSPSWSATNSRLYFYSKRDGNAEIYRMDVDGKNPMRLTYHPASDVLPAPSPDGELVLFMSDRDTRRRNLYVMDNKGSNIKPLTQTISMKKARIGPPMGKK